MALGPKLHLERDVLMHVCRDGTITFRRRGQPVFNGVALPFFSVDTEDDAEQLQVLLCALQYGQHPDMDAGQPWYRYWQFSGEVEDLGALAAKFDETYTRIKAKREEVVGGC